MRSELQLLDLPAIHLEECDGLVLDHAPEVDVAIVIDRSSSTVDPAGYDIDRDGEVGESRLGKFGSAFTVGSTDPGDSLLVAQVLSARALVVALGPKGTQFAIVSFCGRGSNSEDCANSAITDSALTSNVPQLESALDRILSRGSAGFSNFSAGMTEAQNALAHSSLPAEARPAVALFISDAPTPVVMSGSGTPQFYDPKMKEAATAAIDAGIRFHTFGLGRAAAATPPFHLSQIAGATGGKYTPVENAAKLHCDLAAALMH